ncbi:dihydroorotate dehydrogenase electron transfer subunit [Austwickia chelonae]|uniref:Dihydroorotate dehydrogenase electron transfer subunit n=1 Tax=Austwickia chelonae NBRC 105200 TaxID=1184607 RepID=K6VQP0_9MICO|nr:dihydroorotate dehydrogenase electron transfer subunit [Austwickia chelonae]GAB77685.1 dihydroorotate dehydrogenase electron transfer subunit [Austwickia chelonae NBRC 105200]SEW15730.1 dihydroorotate dehydrogenase electron transfer subunit [Austwickia chelonae]
MSEHSTAGVSPAQVTATLVDAAWTGAYRRMVFEADRIADIAEPGHFVTVTVGGELSGALLRRAFSLSRVVPSGGGRRGLVELVVAPHGRGSRWLTALGIGGQVDMVGPSGRPFPLPEVPVSCVLVGGGYGSAPLFWLARSLRSRGCEVAMVLGAADEERLYGVGSAAECADPVLVTTDDGSAGVRGWVSDVLPGLIDDVGATVVYACGPMPMLQAVTRIADAHGATAQVTVEESMACGIGVCMTCVMPVRDTDGRTRMVRSCTEGPTFRGDLVRWESFEDGRCRVPSDAVGAPGTGGH